MNTVSIKHKEIYHYNIIWRLMKNLKCFDHIYLFDW